MPDESVVLLRDAGGGDREWEPGFRTMLVWVGPTVVAEAVAARLRKDPRVLPLLPNGPASVIVEPADLFTLRSLRDTRRAADAPEPERDAPEPVRAAFIAAVLAETWGAAGQSEALLQQAPENAPTVDIPAELPALSPAAAAVLEILLELPSYRGLTGPKILDALSARNPPIHIDQSTLTTRVIPELKAYGIENQRRIGYRIPNDARHTRG